MNIVKKWENAKADLKTTEAAFRQLSNCLEPDWIEQWTREEAKAMLLRGSAMEIYDVAVSKGGPSLEELPQGIQLTGYSSNTH